MASSLDLDNYNDIIMDSDSDDDVPLAELVPLGRARQAENGSQGENNDRSLAEQAGEEEVNNNNDDENGADEEGDDEVEMPTVVNLDTAFDHDWLAAFTKAHGHKLGAGAENLKELDILRTILAPDVVEMLVTETNRYAAQYFEKNPYDQLPKHALARKWKEVDIPEMLAFLGILFFMGYVKLPTYLSYWSTDYLTEMKGFRSVMSRDRFHGIWQFFHLVNNGDALPRDDPDYDRCFKVRPLVDILVNKWQGVYYPGQNVSVDESIVAFKGRSSMIQYNPQKPHKWGIKAWVLAESKTGYMYNWEMYRGSTGRTETGLSEKVVLNITQPIYGHNHHVYMDNFFTSPDLFQKLAENKLGACGTLRPNRTGVPDEIKQVQKKLKKEDPPVFVKDEKYLFISWQDKKTVNVLTTLHNQEVFEKVVRCRDPANNYQRTIIKPKAVEIYNQNMGGVDLADQKLQVYLNVHRTVKWWKKVMLYLLEASFVNANILWKALHPDDRMRTDKFRLAVIHGLVSEYSRETVLYNRHPDPPARRVGRHFVGINPGKTPKGGQSKPDCVVCSDRSVPKGRHQTKYICKTCKVPMHFYPCFERYHTLDDYHIPAHQWHPDLYST
jgi:hypothetical protein